MTFFSRLAALWTNVIHRRRVARDLDDEVRGAYDLLVDDHMRQGMSRDEAKRVATLHLGRIDSVKAQVMDVKAGAFWTALSHDVRYGIRLLVRSPIFTLFAVASLALGIGATAAIFLLFDTIVVRRLPVPEPERLVVASFGRPGTNYNYNLPYPHFEQIRQRSTTLENVFATSGMGRVAVARGGEVDAADGLYVTGAYYDTLRLIPARGRLLQPADDRPGHAVAVLNHAYWQRRFGGRDDVIGSVVTLNAIPFTIVGVEPRGFAGIEVGRPYDIAVPLRATELLNGPTTIWNAAFATWIYITGRLKPGVSLEQAQAETREIFRQVGAEAASTPNQVRLATEHVLALEPGTWGTASGLRRRYERWLGLLMMVLGAVLLLASLNVATLLLSRADARQREMATRMALGASRWRIVRQLLTESLMLAALAGVIGVAIANWGSRLLLRIAVPAAEQPPVDLTADHRMLAFTAIVVLMTAVLIGLIPALRATAPRPFLATRQIGGRRRIADRVLVASQVALSLVLLVGAGLFLRTIANIRALDTGYNRQNVLIFSLDAAQVGKRGEEARQSYRRVLEELQGTPGAQSIAASIVRPVSDNYYFIDSVSQIADKRLPDDQRIRVAFNLVAPGYFGTLGIPLLAGRDFDDRDSPTAPKVVIVSERMARHFVGDPIGQRIGGAEGMEVVGVVKDIRYANVKDAPREVLYFPMFQATSGYTPSFEIKYAGDVSAIVPFVREAVGRVDPRLTIFRMKTLERQTEESLSRERLLAMLTSYFGGFAVLLACIGLYGLMSYGVNQRTPEMGLRMALGAKPSAVRWIVVREATTTVVAGAALGVIAALAAVRLVRSQLFGVEPHDPVAIGVATLVLLTLALLAAYLPARRASRIDPLVALRHE